MKLHSRPPHVALALFIGLMQAATAQPSDAPAADSHAVLNAEEVVNHLVQRNLDRARALVHRNPVLVIEIIRRQGMARGIHPVGYDDGRFAPGVSAIVRRADHDSAGIVRPAVVDVGVIDRVVRPEGYGRVAGRMHGGQRASGAGLQGQLR